MARSVVLSFLGAALLVGCGGSDGAIGPVPEDGSLDAAAEVDDPSMPDADPPDSTGVDSAVDASDAGDAKDAPPIDAATACQAKLVELGVSFKTTAARGVVDAVHVLSPIGGVLFANGTATTPMGDPVACEFVKTLHSFAGLLKSKGFVRVGTLGSYCYRCCCSWSTTNFCRGLTDPEPVCGTSGLSNHSFGRAVDVRYLYKADGTRYDINDPTHWVQYTSTDTCVRGLADQKAGSISLELYTLACDASKTKVFGVVLTPNYNAVHRNHLHMDIGEKGTPTSWITKSWSEVPTGIDDAPLPTSGGEGCGDE